MATYSSVDYRRSFSVSPCLAAFSKDAPKHCISTLSMFSEFSSSLVVVHFLKAQVPFLLSVHVFSAICMYLRPSFYFHFF
jgi:hypothetical protein